MECKQTKNEFQSFERVESLHSTQTQNEIIWSNFQLIYGREIIDFIYTSTMKMSVVQWKFTEYFSTRMSTVAEKLELRCHLKYNKIQ